MTDARAALVELAAALRALHHRLLVATQRSFEKLHGRVAGPGALLELVLHDPLFAWLRPLSQRIAELDELAAAGNLAPSDVDQACARIAALIDGEGEFRASYLVYLQAEPDVVVAHAGLRRLLVQCSPVRTPVEG
jgi:hypothetical protein